MARKTAQEWSEIEAIFRSGTLKNSGIARKFGISESTLRSRIKAGGWTVESREKTAKQEPRNRESLKSRKKAKNTKSSPVLPETGTQAVSAPHDGDIRDGIQTAIATCLHDLATAKDADLVKMHKARAESLKTLAQALEIATSSSVEATRKKGVKEERREAAEQLVSSGRFAPQPPPRVVWDNDKPKNRKADG